MYPFLTYFYLYIDLKHLFFENIWTDLICAALVCVFTFRFLSGQGSTLLRSKVTTIWSFYLFGLKWRVMTFLIWSKSIRIFFLSWATFDFTYFLLSLILNCLFTSTVNRWIETSILTGLTTDILSMQ